MNVDNKLILIKGKDKTSSVESWRFDKFKPVVYITYVNKGHLKEYPYNTADVQFLKDSKVVVLEDRIALKNDSPLSGNTQLHFLADIAELYTKPVIRSL